MRRGWKNERKCSGKNMTKWEGEKWEENEKMIGKEVESGWKNAMEKK